MTLHSRKTVFLGSFRDRASAYLVDFMPVGGVLLVAAVPAAYTALGLLLTGNESEVVELLQIPLFAGVGAKAVFAVYEAWATSVTGQTRGKRLSGLVVVRVRDGRLPAVLASSVRAAVPLAVGLGALVAVWWALPALAPLALVGVYALVHLSACWDENGRGWHDKLAQTVVASAASP